MQGTIKILNVAVFVSSNIFGKKYIPLVNWRIQIILKYQLSDSLLYLGRFSWGMAMNEVHANFSTWKFK